MDLFNKLILKFIYRKKYLNTNKKLWVQTEGEAEQFTGGSISGRWVGKDAQPH